MKQLRRRITRTVLVPLALLVLIVGSTLPASAAAPADYAVVDLSTPVGTYSLNW